MNEPLRILLIAYRFPPHGGGGVQRPAKFVKYWCRMGAQIAVLTGPRDPILADDTLLADIPDSVERVSASDPSPYKRLRDLRARTPRGLRRIVQALIYLAYHLSVPDVWLGWRRPAIRAGSELIVRFRPDVLVVTGPPWTPFLVAEALSQKHGIPLILDYRDPWTRSYLKLSAGIIARRRNAGIERRIVGQASGIVAAHREVLRRLRPWMSPRARWMWVPNGCDPEDIVPLEESKQPSSDVFVLGYTGGFFRWRSPRVLFQAIDRLIQERRIDPNRFRICMAGSVDPAIEELPRRSRVHEVLDVCEYLPHPESIALLQQSTVTLVLEADQGSPNHHTPGKFYEVLHVGRPVLLLCPKGTTTHLARRIGGCWIAHPDDGTAIRAILEELLHHWESGRSFDVPDPSRIQFYERAHQATRLHRFIRDLVETRAKRMDSGG